MTMCKKRKQGKKNRTQMGKQANIHKKGRRRRRRKKEKTIYL